MKNTIRLTAVIFVILCLVSCKKEKAIEQGITTTVTIINQTDNTIYMNDGFFLGRCVQKDIEKIFSVNMPLYDYDNKNIIHHAHLTSISLKPHDKAEYQVDSEYFDLNRYYTMRDYTENYYDRSNVYICLYYSKAPLNLDLYFHNYLQYVEAMRKSGFMIFGEQIDNTVIFKVTNNDYPIEEDTASNFTTYVNRLIKE